MTIAKILRQQPAAASVPDIERRTALAFAFDAGYLMPFKTIVSSMVRAGTMLHSPVHIYSDDPAVFDDAFVKKVADRCILIDGDLRDQLYELAQNNVRRTERTKWNRGTFLKWAVFRPANEDQVLFLDVDMVCLAEIEPLLTLRPDADMVGCAQFQKRMMVDDNERPVSSQVLADRIQGMFDDRSRMYMGRLNSGVMLIRTKLLSDDFRNEIMAFARQGVEVNEQSQMTKFFAQKKYRLRIISSEYNFHESYLASVDAEDARKLLAQVRILHYPGGEKPWKADPSAPMRPSMKLWWDAHADLPKLEEQVSV